MLLWWFSLFKCSYVRLVAGTGKSLLLRAIIAALRKKHAGKPDAVSVTASTGMAASNIGGKSPISHLCLLYLNTLTYSEFVGMTIHAWGAVAPTCSNIDTLISYIKTCKPALHRWKNTQVLVIDEGQYKFLSRLSYLFIFTVVIRWTVSMVDGHLFDKLAAIADQLRRKTDRPFGGIQVGLLFFIILH
jgi:ATP-dependent DNA helicase PIF1